MIDMATLKIERRRVEKFGDKWHTIVPKPRYLVGRIEVHVPDEVVRNREVQPVLDAYALKMKKPEWVGKTPDQYREELNLEFGFHVISFDDGSSVEDVLR
jgi:hypothetical protein